MEKSLRLSSMTREVHASGIDRVGFDQVSRRINEFRLHYLEAAARTPKLYLLKLQ